MLSGTNCFDSSMEDITASSRHARACPGHPRLSTVRKQDVDGRVKPGHDDQCFFGKTHNAPCANVLQACTVPCWYPVMNHCLRCAAEPWVKLSGTTLPVDCRCSVSS